MPSTHFFHSCCMLRAGFGEKYPQSAVQAPSRTGPLDLRSFHFGKLLRHCSLVKAIIIIDNK